MKLGWIGIGKMGNPMATRLLEAGNEMYVCDVSKSSTDEICAKGAKFIPTPAKLAEEVDIIFSIIPNSKILKAIVMGEDGLIETIKKDSIYIDMSTVDPVSSAEVNAAIEAKGAFHVRANVSGSVEFAREGTLSGLSSGPRAAYDKVLPLLNVLTAKQYYMGANDEARAMKIIINMLLGTSMLATAESLVMGEKLGLDWETMVDAIVDSAAASPSAKFKREMFKKRDFRPMSTAGIMDKDMNFALDIAKDNQLNLPLAAMSRQFYCGMGSTGMWDLDYAATLLVLEEMNGVTDKESILE